MTEASFGGSSPRTPQLAELLTVLPPFPGNEGDRRVDQAGVPAAEAALGVRLPGDYVEFVALYGAGDIGDHFAIARPFGELTDSPYSPSMMLAGLRSR